MSIAQTYSSLKADLAKYLQRYDALITDQIPSFIALAQIRIPREMKILGFRREATGVFNGSTLTNGIMQKPSDWRKTIAFYVGTGVDNNTHTPVLARDYSYIRTAYPDASVKGTPRFYGDAAYDYWLVQPTPASAMPYKIPYFATLTQLDDTTQTNWLTENAPDMLLYGSLLEAMPFIKTDERLPIWQAGFDRGKVALQTMEIEGKLDGQAFIYNPQTSSVLPR